MAEALMIGFAPAEEAHLRQLLAQKGVRARSSIDCNHALHWIGRRDFVLVWVAESVELSEQQKVSELVWSRNPLTPVTLVDTSLSPDDLHERSKLLGLTVISGEDTTQKLHQLLSTTLENQAVSSQNPQVLLVEDLDSPRDIICSYIESLGPWQVTGVNSASSAISELEKDPRRFCCIVTDIRMPDISGAELIQQIQMRHDLRHLPVVALTAHGTVDCLIDCLKAGASGFLVKPPKREDLRRELQRCSRLLANRQPTRLVSSVEAERLRDYLIQSGYME